MIELWCSVWWKVEIFGDKIGYLTEEIPKQSVKIVTLFIFTTYRTIREEKNKLKLFSKKETELENLENCQSTHISENEKNYSEKNIKNVAKQPSDKIN